MYALSARGETPRTPPLNHPFNLVVGKVNHVLMRVYSLENEKATFLTGQVHNMTIPERFPTATFALTRTIAQYTSVPFNSVTYLSGEWTTIR